MLAFSEQGSTLLPREDASQLPSSKHGTPNVLLLYPDQWRWDWTKQASTGAPPTTLSTPTFDSTAAEGVRFDFAYVPAPLCGPSRSALALGREYDPTGVIGNEDVERVLQGKTTVYRALRDAAGYHVMMSGKDDLSVPYGAQGEHRATELGYSAWAGRSPGKNHHERGSGPYAEFLASQTVRMDDGSVRNALVVSSECHTGIGAAACCQSAQTGKVGEYYCVHSLPDEWPEEWYYDNWVGEKALKMLKERPKDKPWFMQVNFPGPHPPQAITRSMHKAVSGRHFEMPIDNARETAANLSDAAVNFSDAAAEVRGGVYLDAASAMAADTSASMHLWARRSYAAEIENIDRWFGKLITAVRELGDYDNTLICIASDHGEMLGDHGQWGKILPYAAIFSKTLRAPPCLTALWPSLAG